MRFVITLDSDTRLPHAAARKLVGTLAPSAQSAALRSGRASRHARLRRLAAARQCESGQRRAARSTPAFSPTAAGSIRIAPPCPTSIRICSAKPTFTGKGIYDVDAFAAAVADTFPPNHILSHDLIEGCFARVGAVTDVELFDEYPTRFDADIRRQHRWVRGDWQLLPWLLPSVPMVQGESRQSAVGSFRAGRSSTTCGAASCRWRSCCFGSRAGFCCPAAAWLPTTFAAVVLVSPFLFHAVSVALHWPAGETWRQHIGELLATLGRTLLQCVLSLAFLPARALTYTDAIVRTLYRLVRVATQAARMGNCRRHRTPAQAAALVVSHLRWAGSRWRVVGIAFLLPPANRPWAAPVLALWFLSPWIAHFLSKPTVKSDETLSAEDQAALRRIARRTWSFFEAFVGEEDNWLPPDNYQEFPQPKIAHRISPTNEGHVRALGRSRRAISAFSA